MEVGGANKLPFFVMKESVEYNNTKHILDGIDKFNESGDTKYLWDIFDDLRHCVQSLYYKRLKGNPHCYDNFIENSIMVTEKWLIDIKKRRDKGNPYKITSPISYAHYMLLRYLPSDDAIWNLRCSMSDITEKNLSEDGHNITEKDD